MTSNIINVGTPGHVDHRGDPRIIIIDEHPVICSQEIAEFLEAVDNGFQPLSWQLEFMAQLESMNDPVEQFRIKMKKHLDECKRHLPVKNEHHSNEPWRRKQWRHR